MGKLPSDFDPQRQRQERWYLVLMLTCIALLAIAWFGVRLWSTAAAIGLSCFAALLPGVAVVVANRGFRK
ncbi:MAG TPA: DUF3099 domain-containing protein [Segeticoccus sp.]|uniref:DUF3099 domain-containing protein n=1 Tax=Segeticoccus sp. TaxID=2706531 RepID=UPI002D7F06DA|nr:DUF3099 domain-containing protein [Segeticoccus sp.]HET8599502.1 DUF3099 domain-containing protein [Segeticoccus sp.]